MAKLNIKFNSGESYSFDTKTAKEKPASVQKEMQESSPRPGDSVTQILIRDLAKMGSLSAGQSAPVERGSKHIAQHEGTTIQKRSPSRVGDVLSGAVKTYAGTSANSLGTVISGTKLAREVDTQQWSNEAARYAHEMNNAADEQERAYWKAQLDQVSRNIVNAKKATERSDAGAQRVFDTADKLTDSGSRDISTAKAGMGKFGQIMTDVGVAGTQMAADAAIGTVTGGGALVPMAARSFGGGAQEARRSGADVKQQLAYGLGNAAIQVGTEKMFNVATPFKKMFGEGILDKALTRATGKLSQSAAGKAALSALGEASEEAVGDLLDPVIRRLTFDKNATVDSEQMLSDAIVGSVLGLAGGGVDAVRGIPDTIQQHRENRSSAAVDSAYDSMQQNGVFSNEARGAVKDAQKKFTGNDHMTQMFIDTLAGKKRAQEAAGTAQGGQAGNLAPAAQTAQDVTQRPITGLSSKSPSATSETVLSNDLAGKTVEAAPEKGDFLLDILTGKKRVDQGKLTDAQFETAADHGLNIDADGKVYRPLPTGHIDRRTVESAGNRDVNAFQFDHPELHEYYKKAAESLMADADISTQFPMPRRTERTVNGKRTIQSAIDSVSLRSAMDMGLSRNQIINAAQSLIDDHGQENYAAAKRLELVLDEMLTNGYTTVFGDAVEPNSAYIKAKTDIVGSSPAESGEELPIWDMPEADGGRIDSLGSARGGFDPYSRLQNQTDAANFHDDGANAARVVDVPKTNFEGRNVPESAKTVMGARAIDGDDVRMIERQIANGALAFDTITDEKAVAKAQNTIRQKTFDGALEQYRASVESNVASKDNTTLGQQLLIQAMHDGNTANVSELLSLYTRNSTTAAQAMQAQAIFRKLSPEGQLLSIQKAVDSFNQKHDTGIEIDPEDMDAFVNAADDDARGKAAETIFKHVAEQAPGTFKAKYDAIRYLAMLGNPRTHIRNILGNTLFQVPVAAKNRVGGVADAIASVVSGGKYERTKSITGVSPASQLAKECRADWANAKDFLSHGSKYTEGQTSLYNIEAEQKAFSDKGAGKVINKASELNSALLEAEDTFAKKFIYTQSLAGYLKANGVKSISEADAGLLNRARSYAAQEALRNTFNDTNSLSEAVSKLNGLRDNKNPFIKAAGYGVEGVLPFKKTPANILMRGTEYSPVGAVMGVIDTIRGTRHGDAAELTQGLDRIASGLTGSALLTAGVLAAGAGYVSGGDDEDEKQQNFNELTGHQNYALELKNGKSITLDWTAPEAIPFFMGVELQKACEDNGLSPEEILSAVKKSTSPMLEMTMLQGLNDVLEDVSYAQQKGKNPLAAIATAALTNYVTQVFPTAFGQLERAGDEVRETTYTDKNSGVSTDTQYLFGKVANKIPGVDYNQIPFIDAWGREEDQGDTATRIFNNVFNPAYVSDVKVRPVEQELQRLSDKTGETNVFPQRADKSITYSVAKGDDTVSKQKDLTADEYVKFAKALGQEKYKLLNSAVGSGYYKAMSDAEKADYVGKLYQYAAAQAKGTVASGVVNDAWIDNARASQRDIGVSTPEYIALHEKYGSALVGSSYEKVKTAVKAGVSIEDYMSVRGTMDGNDNGSISQAEARAALDASGLSRVQKDTVWRSINSTWKKNPYR